MSLEIWIAFALASAVLLAIPGPTVMLVVSYALGRGRESAWATVPGVSLGDLTAMTVSLAGAGAVLAIWCGSASGYGARCRKSWRSSAAPGCRRSAAGCSGTPMW